MNRIIILCLLACLCAFNAHADETLPAADQLWQTGPPLASTLGFGSVGQPDYPAPETEIVAQITTPEHN